MPPVAGLTVVLDWDDAKVKKGIADLNAMLGQIKMPSLSFGGGAGVNNPSSVFEKIKNTAKPATDAITTLKNETAKLTREYQNLYLADKQNTDQGDRTSEALKQRAAVLKEVSNSLKAITNPKPIKVEQSIPAIDQLKARVASLRQEYERLLLDNKASAIKIREAANAYNEAQNKLNAVNTKVRGTSDAYGRLAQAANKATREAQNLGAQYGAKSNQFVIAAKRADQLTQKLKDIDAATGRNFRNVGNYTGSLGGIQNSFAQIAREIPSTINNIQAMALALSNNIPIFYDNIRALVAQNKALAASGQPTVSALSAIKSALFSWNTAMTIGIALLVVYGKDIKEWAQNIMNGKDATKYLKDELVELKKAQESSYQTAGQQIGVLRSLNAVLMSNTSSVTAKKGAYEKMIKLYPSHKEQLEDEYKRTGQLSGVIKQLTQNIIAAAKARALEARIGELSSKNLVNQDKQVELGREQNKQAVKLLETEKEYLRLRDKYSDDSERLRRTRPDYSKALSAYAIELKAAKKLKDQWQEVEVVKRQNESIINSYANDVSKLQPQLGNLTVEGVDAGTFAKNVKKASDSAKTVSDVIKDVNNELKLLERENSLNAIGDSGDYVKKRFDILRGAVRKLFVEFKQPASNPFVQSWLSEMAELNGVIKANELAEKQTTKAQTEHNKKIEEAKRYNERLTDTFRDLNEQLSSTSKLFSAGLITSSEKDKEELSLLESAYRKLITTFNLPIDSESIKKIFSDISELKTKSILNGLADDALKLNSRLSQIDLSKSLGFITNSEASSQKISSLRTRLQLLIDTLKSAPNLSIAEAIKTEIDDIGNALSDLSELESAQAALQSALNSIASGVMDAFASIFSYGGGFESLFSGMLSSIGKAIQEFGKQLIMIGAIKELIDKSVAALSKIGGAPLVIAGGIAAIAAGAYLQSIAQRQQAQSFKAFADGGIVSGPTMGLVGEYANASVDPEVIAPLSKLQGMLSDMAPVNVNVVGRINGKDLVLIMDRQNEFNNR